MMVPEMEKPRVTEIKVRMDCNGCVQKIKKVLNGITGIHDINVDFPQQKITIIGWADPEKIVKAIKKARKGAVICLHTEPQPGQLPQPQEPKPEEGATHPGPASTPETEPTQTEPPEPPKEGQPQPEPNPSPEIAKGTPIQPEKPSEPKDREESHGIHHPPNYGYRYAYGNNFPQGFNEQGNAYYGGPQSRDGPSQPPQTFYATHSYNTYNPSPHVTEYAYPTSPRYSRHSVPDDNTRYSIPDYNTRYTVSDYNTRYNVPDNNTRYTVPDYNTRYGVPDYNTHYSMPDNYSRDYYSGNNGNGSITSMFSEENPNACRIV